MRWGHSAFSSRSLLLSGPVFRVVLSCVVTTKGDFYVFVAPEIRFYSCRAPRCDRNYWSVGRAPAAGRFRGAGIGPPIAMCEQPEAARPGNDQLSRQFQDTADGRSLRR